MSIERLINHHPKFLTNSTNKLNNFSNITSSNNITNSTKINNSSSIPISNCASLQENHQALVSLISNATSAAVSSHGNFPQINDQITNKISLRFLNPDDINELKTLCSEWFPVELSLYIF
jgi:hypothetical protein